MVSPNDKLIATGSQDKTAKVDKQMCQQYLANTLQTFGKYFTIIWQIFHKQLTNISQNLANV